MNDLQKPVLEAKNVVREFKEGPLSVSVLRGANLSIQAGEQIAIIGSSGSGKTTLLHLLGGLDHPTSGEITILGKRLQGIRERALCALRNRYFGFVYQFHHLLPEFTALENVAMPLLIGKTAIAEAKARAADLLENVGLKDRYHHKVGELSGGERQRVAIARALVTKPQCVLADEPTGNLDKQTAEQVYKTLQTLHRETHTAFILVTHDHQLARQMDTVYTLENGILHRTTTVSS